MNKLALALILCFVLAPAFSTAEESQAPPIPAGDNSEPLPPPVDLGPVTPLPESSAGETAPEPPPPMPAATSAPASQAAPPLAPLPPTDTPTAQVIARETPTAEVPAAPKEKPEAVRAGAVLKGDLADYFPATPGARWSYEYLKPAEGGTEKQTRTVECVGAKAMANGTLRVEMKATEGGAATLEKYSLFENKVQHTFEGKEPLAGDFAFKLPPAGGSADWTRTDADGVLHACRASYGQAQVYQKTYPDCVIVREKVMKGKDWSHTLISYYAKGIGLVAVEFYMPGMKLVEPKSIALVEK